MEHLTYNPNDRAFRAELRSATRLTFAISNWELYDEIYGICPPVEPRVPWLGYDHLTASCVSQLDDSCTMLDLLHSYSNGWDFDAMFTFSNLRKAHRALEDNQLSEHEVVLRIASHIQSSLYFGLLEAICKRPISTTFLVRADADGCAYMYSRNLALIIETWMRNLNRLDYSERREVLTEARECAVLASAMLHHDLVHLAKDNLPTSFILLRDKIFSIEPALTCLAEALIRCTEFHLQVEIRGSNIQTVISSRPYRERLIAKGWCPYVLASAEIYLSPSLLYIVETTGLVCASQGHHKCTSKRCERNFVVRETYSQQHTPPKCRCKFLKPDLGVALEILEAGYFPVARFDSVAEKIELGGVHPLDLYAHYIAFSHVWADGLGSCTEVGLPACQVRRLHELVSNRPYLASAFWIDGLCIPRQEPHRGIAIELMKSTYSNATGVIVLDSSFKELSLHKNIIEIGWTVFASGWFGRLWTFQEGYVARWVDLQVKDGFIDLSMLVRRLHNLSRVSGTVKFPALFARDLLALLQKARPLSVSASQRPMQKRIVDLFNALTRRDSSRPDDQILVMGLVLGIDIHDFLELEGEDKWRAFYLSLKCIPWTIIFDRRPKMQLNGFHWAPISWISTGQDEFLHYDEQLADITEEGLCVELDILCLDETLSPSFQLFYVQVDSQLYQVFRSIDETSDTLGSFNLIVVRHFAHEKPETNLEQHRSILMRVALGYLDETTSNKLRYDSTLECTIALPAEYDDVELDDAKIVIGTWRKHKLCFS